GCNGEMGQEEKGVVEEVLAWARSWEDQDDDEDKDEDEDEDEDDDDSNEEVGEETHGNTELQEDQQDDTQMNNWHCPKRKRTAKPKETQQERSTKLAKRSQ